MKQLTCEMCGSTDLVKQDGVFVCQSCGCKYSVEEAKKMMVEGTVDVSGSTIFVDNSGLINSYQQMAVNASDAGNFSEAEEYANKIIEIDPQFYHAWFIKGKAAGWQTTGISNRFPESIVSWINAYQYAPEESKAEIVDEISKEASSISFAIMTMKSNSFVDFRSEENVLGVLNSESLVEDQLKELKEKTGIDVNTQLFKESIGRIINTGAVNASNNADKEFGPENSNRGRFEWDRFTDAQERCLKLLDRAYSLSFDDDLCYSICNNYVLIANSILNSCSYTFDASSGIGRYVREYGFAGEGRNKAAESMSLDKWQKKRDEHNPEKRKSNLSETQQLIKNARKATEKDLAIAQYWETHSNEKSALESEIIELDEKISQYNSSLDSNPDKLEMSRIRTEIDNLEDQRSSLGMFKSKEKKKLTEQIEKLTEEESVSRDKWRKTYEATEKEINETVMRKKEIQAEFVKDRGPAKIVPQYYITLFDGENGAVNALDLINYHKAVLPDNYTVKGEGREAVENHTEELKEAQALYEEALAKLGVPNTSTDKLYDETDENTIYRLKFLVSGKEKNIVLEFTSKDIDSNISKGITYILEGDRPPSSIADYVLIVTYSLLGICPDIDLDVLEKDITEIAFGFLGSGTIIEMDNLLCTITGGTKRGLKLAITSKPAS